MFTGARIFTRFASSTPAGSEARIRNLCEQGQLHGALDLFSWTPGPLSSPTYLSLLNASIQGKSLSLAKLLHDRLASHRTHLSLFLTDYWVMALAKCGAIEEALQVSASVPHLTIFSWTAIISAYAECGRGHEAFQMHQCMLNSGIKSDKYTFVSLFKACGSIKDLQLGRKLHADARYKGITHDVFVCNTLVSMYGKCGAVLDAEEVFCSMSYQTRVSWNAMLSVYVDSGHGRHALLLYRQMQEKGESPNELTFLLTIQACSFLMEGRESSSPDVGRIETSSLQIGRALHVDAHRMGCTSDILVGSSLISMYGKCGSIIEAETEFAALSYSNVVSWTALVSAYVAKGQGVRALQFFTEMHRQGLPPNELTYRAALQALDILIESFSGQETKVPHEVPELVIRALQKDSDRLGFTSDPLVGNMFMSLYSKYWNVFEAETIYRSLSAHDTVSCNTMLLVYIEQGELGKALDLFKTMQVELTSMDEVSFMCMLQLSGKIVSLEVCNYVHFGIISAEHGSTPVLATTLIDAYGSCGSSVDAEMVLERAFWPDEALRNACLTSHADEGNCMATFSILEKFKAAGMKTDKILCTAVLSACSHSGLVTEGLEYFDSWYYNDMTPDLQHYCILVGMLGRAGNFLALKSLFKNMRMQADASTWLYLLGTCRMHGHLELANFAFQNAVDLLPEEAVAYVLVRNIYNYSWGHEAWSIEPSNQF